MFFQCFINFESKRKYQTFKGFFWQITTNSYSLLFVKLFWHMNRYRYLQSFENKKELRSWCPSRNFFSKNWTFQQSILCSDFICDTYVRLCFAQILKLRNDMYLFINTDNITSILTIHFVLLKWRLDLYF